MERVGNGLHAHGPVVVFGGKVAVELDEAWQGGRARSGGGVEGPEADGASRLRQGDDG